MAEYDSGKGLFYEITYNDEDIGIDPTSMNSLVVESSITSLFPTVSFTLANGENMMIRGKQAQIFGKFKIILGKRKDDEDAAKVTLADFVVEKWALVDANTSWTGKLKITLAHKLMSKFKTLGPAKSFVNVTTDAALTSLIGDDFENSDVETSTITGTWVKPSNQSILDFLQILKNRTITSSSSASMMFLWTDEDGKLYFKSLASLINEEPVDTIDLTKEGFNILTPVSLNFYNHGIRYRPEDKPTVFTTYEQVADEPDGDLTAPETVTIEKPEATVMGGDEFTGADVDLYGGEANSILEGVRFVGDPENLQMAMYTNRLFNYPYRMSFVCQFHPLLKPGKVVKMLFKGSTESKAADTVMSGNYLILGRTLRAEKGRLMMMLEVATNSVHQDSSELFVNADLVT